MLYIISYAIIVGSICIFAHVSVVQYQHCTEFSTFSSARMCWSNWLVPSVEKNRWRQQILWLLSGCLYFINLFFLQTDKHMRHKLSWAQSDTPHPNTQRPAAYQIGTAGINTFKKNGVLRGSNQILSTTKTIVEGIWWTDGNFRLRNAALPGASRTPASPAP